MIKVTTINMTQRGDSNYDLQAAIELMVGDGRLVSVVKEGEMLWRIFYDDLPRQEQ